MRAMIRQFCAAARSPFGVNSRTTSGSLSSEICAKNTVFRGARQRCTHRRDARGRKQDGACLAIEVGAEHPEHPPRIIHGTFKPLTDLLEAAARWKVADEGRQEFRDIGLAQGEVALA